MNDWSARDLQRKEMKVGLGPAKGKDFATSLGPDRSSRPTSSATCACEMVARVNGEERSRGNLGDMYHSWEAILEHAARNTRAAPRRRDRLGHGRHRLHPRARRRALAPARRRGRARGRGDRRPAQYDRLTMKVAVIGGGVMGLATGWALRRRGHEPVVYEQFRVGHERGSSHGRSRIFRLAYAEDDYVRLAQESLGLWRELEGETGETVLELNGLVEVVQTLEESTAHTLERCGVAWERLERSRGRGALPDPRSRGLVRRRPARGRDRPSGQGARRLRAATSTCARTRASGPTSSTRTRSSSPRARGSTSCSTSRCP